MLFRVVMIVLLCVNLCKVAADQILGGGPRVVPPLGEYRVQHYGQFCRTRLEESPCIHHTVFAALTALKCRNIERFIDLWIS